jgi:hypothetical protein
MREKIILFIQKSPNEVNSNVAAFIAGMQAQKDLTASRWKTDNSSSLTIEEDSPGEETGRAG